MISPLGSESANGVAILIHKDFRKQVIVSIALSNRVLYMDVKISSKVDRIVAVYLSHAGYPWTDFEDQMNLLSQLTTEAQVRGYYIVVAGDFNLDLHAGARR